MVKDELVIVLPPAEVDPYIKGQQVFSYMGVMGLLDRLSNYTGKLSRVKADKLAESDRRKDILSVTGPIPNILTRYLLQRPEIVYRFEDHAIVSAKDSSWKIEAIRDMNGNVQRDYGIITRMKNPYAANRTILIASGCWGWGTQAALRVLAHPESLNYLNKSKLEYFQVICTCDVDLELIGLAPHLLDIHPDTSIKQQTLVEL
jgi:hypothetical protein